MTKMATIFWTGKLSLQLQLMVNTSCLISWITGNAIDTSAMKQRVKNGYNAKFSNYVNRYDEFGLSHYSNISTKLLEGVDIRDKEVIDVGCGTGILSIFALKQGPAKMICGDVS